MKLEILESSGNDHDLASEVGLVMMKGPGQAAVAFKAADPIFNRHPSCAQDSSFYLQVLSQLELGLASTLSTAIY
jgi:hypothetical protein